MYRGKDGGVGIGGGGGTEEKEEGDWLDGGKTEDKGLKEGDEGEEKMGKAGRNE